MDHQIYAALLSSIPQTVAGDGLVEEIMERGDPGCGRKALRIIDEYYFKLGQEEKLIAKEKLETLSPLGPGGLRKYIEDWKTFVRQLDGGGLDADDATHYRLSKMETRMRTGYWQRGNTS